MNNDKLPKIAVAQINPKVGDFEYNKNLIIKYLENAKANNAKANSDNIDLLIFPELCVCGYDPRDLALRDDFCNKSYSIFEELVFLSVNYDFGFVVGSLKLESEKRYNSAFFIYNGKILFEYKKRELPNYGVFDEKRLYNSGSDDFSSVSFRGLNFSILICEDLWNENNYSDICKNFYKHGVGFSAIYNVGRFYIGFNRINAGFNLWNHSAFYSAII
jgi:predicted amidohydrolase